MDSSGNENSFIYYCSLSHYQIIVVMLDQDTPVSDLPHPDKAFPAINAFLAYDTAIPTRIWGYAGYITAEFSRDLFPSDGRFTVGDPIETANDRTEWYPNSPLQYGSRYTFFLRAYPLINTGGQAVVSVWMRAEVSAIMIIIAETVSHLQLQCLHYRPYFRQVQ